MDNFTPLRLLRVKAGRPPLDEVVMKAAAHGAALDVPSLSRIERGLKPIGGNAEALAKVYGIPVSIVVQAAEETRAARLQEVA